MAAGLASAGTLKIPVNADITQSPTAGDYTYATNAVVNYTASVVSSTKAILSVTRNGVPVAKSSNVYKIVVNTNDTVNLLTTVRNKNVLFISTNAYLNCSPGYGRSYDENEKTIVFTLKSNTNAVAYVLVNGNYASLVRGNNAVTCKVSTATSSAVVEAKTQPKYSITYAGENHGGYFSPSKAYGKTSVSWTSTNAALTCEGIVLRYSGDSKAYEYDGPGPWVLNISRACTISGKVNRQDPVPFPVQDGMLSLGIACSTSEWKSVEFGSPTAIAFKGGANKYLYPSSADAIMVQAVDGDVYLSLNATNATVQVATKGAAANVPCAPVTIKRGQSISIKGKVTKLFVKGAGTANIMGIAE